MADTLGDMIRERAVERTDKPAFTFEDRTITYGQLDARSSQVAKALQADGVGPGDRVAFLDKNSPSTSSCCFGAAKLNAVIVAVNWRLAPPEVAHIVNDAEAKVLVVGPDFVPCSTPSQATSTTVKKFVVLGRTRRPRDYEDWVAAHPPDDPGTDAVDRRRRVPALHVGHDRPAQGRDAHQRTTCSRSCRGATPRLRLDERQREPRRHAAVPHRRQRLRHGRHVRRRAHVLMREVDPGAILQPIPENGITNTFFVPAVLQFMLIVPGVDDIDFRACAPSSTARRRSRSRCSPRSIEPFGCRLHPGVRAHRDDGRDRAPAAGGPRPGRPERPPAARRRQARSPASSCASSTRHRRRLRDRARSARSGSRSPRT